MVGHFDPYLTPGTLLAGKYRLLHRLGQGGMGVVWAARNESTAREVALKLLVQPNQDLRARLLREARACGRLRHRNIVAAYDVEVSDRGDPFLVMELLQGETLLTFLRRRRRLDPPEAARIARYIARGLAAAHALQVVHRDLKPANVFLHIEPDERDFVVKLLDFGISKLTAGTEVHKTATGVVLGSPAYMSPEQLRGDPDIDGRCDLWSLGVVLFEMLAGARPFSGNVDQVMTRVLDGEPPQIAQLVRDLDPELARVVTDCLQRDRNRRPASAAEVASRLDPFAAQDARTSMVGLQIGTQPSPSSPALVPMVAPLAPPPALGGALPSIGTGAVAAAGPAAGGATEDTGAHERTTQPFRRWPQRSALPSEPNTTVPLPGERRMAGSPHDRARPGARGPRRRTRMTAVAAIACGTGIAALTAALVLVGPRACARGDAGAHGNAAPAGSRAPGEGGDRSGEAKGPEAPPSESGGPARRSP